MRKKIAWITADYFIDVDIPIVPRLRRDCDIEWYVLQGSDGKIAIPPLPDGCEMHLCKMPYRRRNPKCIEFYADLAKRIQTYNPDIIYIDALEMPYLYPVFDYYLPRHKMVHAAHNVVSYPGWPNRRLMQVYLKYVFSTHKHFHIFSRHTQLEFEKMYKGKHILCTPLSLKDYGKPSSTARRPDDKVNFLFFGNVKQNKRLDILLQAFAALPQEIRNKAHLSVLGYCDNKQPYEQLIALLGDSVTFNPNRIPDEDIPDIFASHHYLVLPYENVAQSGPHMIAYNYNIPVIATRIEGFTEHITDGEDGFLFEVNDIKDLTRILTTVIDMSPIGYEALRANLSEIIASRYASEVLLQEYKNFFDSI